MKLRRLNAAGLSRFGQFLDSLTGDAPLPTPISMLESDETTELLTDPVHVDALQFATRLELGAYLSQKLVDAGCPNIDSDVGLWGWLSLFYFDSFCVPNRAGRRKAGERARWLLDPSNFKRYYRHLLAGPYRIVRAYSNQPEVAMCLLCGAPGTFGELVEQFASRQELVTNRAVIDAATQLYYDAGARKLKRGAGGKGEGSARRLAAVLQQFDVTYDLYALSSEELLRLLPVEFDRFKPIRR